MRVKTSISLDPSTLAELDEIAGSRVGSAGSRSRLIEEAILAFVERWRRRRREAQDLAILNRAADELNREMEDILTYQEQP